MTFHEALAQFYGSAELIPDVKGSYGATSIKSGKLRLNANDYKVFDAVYNLDAGDKNVGNGEVGLYWLFNYAKKNRNKDFAPSTEYAKENRGGSEPDLVIHGKQVEAKSYEDFLGKTTNIGRFQAQKDFRKLIAYMFAAKTLIQPGFQGELNFGYHELAAGADDFCKLREALKQVNDLVEIPIFKEMQKEVDAFDSLAMTALGSNAAKKCGVGSTGSRVKGHAIATEIIRYGIKELIGKKPGDGGYVVNVQGSKDKWKGVIEFYQIKLDNMNTDPNVLGMGKSASLPTSTMEQYTETGSSKTFAFNGGTFMVNLARLFPNK